jgi:hypothetical protein
MFAERRAGGVIARTLRKWRARITDVTHRRLPFARRRLSPLSRPLRPPPALAASRRPPSPPPPRHRRPPPTSRRAGCRATPPLDPAAFAPVVFSPATAPLEFYPVPPRPICRISFTILMIS